MIGMSTFAFTGFTRLLFWLSKIPTASIRAFAAPCLPGDDVDILVIFEASPPNTKYFPCFKVFISATLVAIKFPRKNFLWFKYNKIFYWLFYQKQTKRVILLT